MVEVSDAERLWLSVALCPWDVPHMVCLVTNTMVKFLKSVLLRDLAVQEALAPETLLAEVLQNLELLFVEKVQKVSWLRPEGILRSFAGICWRHLEGCLLTVCHCLLSHFREFEVLLRALIVLEEDTIVSIIQFTEILLLEVLDDLGRAGNSDGKTLILVVHRVILGP